MSRRAWTDEEMGCIASTMDEPRRKVAKQLGRTEGAVSAMRHKIHSGWIKKNFAWTAEEDEIIRTSTTLTADSLCRLLPGRSAQAIVQRRHNLGVKVGSRMHRSPHALGARTLLARTCNQCGLLLPAQWFSLSGEKSGSRNGSCRQCRSSYAKKYEKSRSTESNPSKSAWVNAAQSISLKAATRYAQEYTDSEHAVLADPSMTILSKALTLGRTYIAVATTVSRNGYRSGRWLGDAAFDRWIIDNPNLLNLEEITAALKQECAAAGVQFPEWDWDDRNLEETA